MAQETGASSGAVRGFEHVDGMVLEPAVLSYDATVKTGGRAMDLSSTLTVTSSSTEGADTWTIVNKINTPGGRTIDSLVVDRSSLLPLSRRRRGGTDLDITYAGLSEASTAGSGKGTVSGMVGEEPVSVTLNGPVLAGGVHDVIVLGAMPLEPGFRAVLRVFSPQDQSTKSAKFEVVGTETVETPAGTFETYVVDLNVGEGYVTGTVHLQKKAPHYYVKWNTEVTTDRGTRTISQVLTSMETPP